jgi:hypothetical protein
MRRVLLLALVSAALAGCTHSGSTGDAILRLVCARNDGSATELSVPPSPSAAYPQFRLRVDQPLAQVAGKVIQVTDPDSAGAYAQWCDASGCRVVRPGPTSVTFGTLRADSSITVDVRTTGADGKAFAWRGVARWHGGDVSACG